MSCAQVTSRRRTKHIIDSKLCGRQVKYLCDYTEMCGIHARHWQRKTGNKPLRLLP